MLNKVVINSKGALILNGQEALNGVLYSKLEKNQDNDKLATLTVILDVDEFSIEVASERFETYLRKCAHEVPANDQDSSINSNP